MRGLRLLLLCCLAACSRDRDDATRLPPEERRDAGVDACAGAYCQGSCTDLRASPEHCGRCDHRCASGMGCADGLCTTASGWHASGRQAIGDAVACVPRTRFAVRCPPQHEAGGSVWGVDIYTDDSSVCQAAVHAGRITEAAGGDVIIEVRGGMPFYRGGVRNGVITEAFGPWRCSYVVTGDRCAAATTKCGSTCSDLLSDAQNCGACGHACGADETCRAGACVLGIDGDWRTTASRWTCTVGQAHVVRCPRLPSVFPFSAVYGSGPYTSDSSICAAAVHAGKLTRAGGEVTIELSAGLKKYPGSSANGVDTSTGANWSCSFGFR